MSLVGFKARNHPQQLALFGPDRSVDDRALPPEAFAKLNERFDFTVDAAASAHNAKLPRYYTIENSGLLASWAGERVYCNPPYSDLRPWVEKAWSEGGGSSGCSAAPGEPDRTKLVARPDRTEARSRGLAVDSRVPPRPAAISKTRAVFRWPERTPSFRRVPLHLELRLIS